MKILFLNHSGKPGGAELALLDIASPYRNDHCLVGLFEDGAAHAMLEQRQIPVQILASQSIQVRKNSNIFHSLGSIPSLVPLIAKVAKLSRNYDLIYANNQKAFIVGAIASFLSKRPLVYHLHDIISAEHFSLSNRRLIVTLANRFASIVIANSRASQKAFIEAGGSEKITEVVYNGFQPEYYNCHQLDALNLRQALQLNHQFVVGHFSRLSSWKGQHILIEALKYCSEDVTALFVGDALFGEQDYVKRLHHQVVELGLENRVQFMGFRSDIPQLMTACNLIAHTSTAPEPFGRVIAEAMMCGRPVIASQAGGAVELVRHGETGWLCLPNEPRKLADIIMICRNHPEQSSIIAQQAQKEASHRFHIDTINQQINHLLNRVSQNS